MIAYDPNYPWRTMFWLRGSVIVPVGVDLWMASSTLTECRAKVLPACIASALLALFGVYCVREGGGMNKYLF